MSVHPLVVQPRVASPDTDDGWMLDVLSVLVNRYRISDLAITYCNQAWSDHYGVPQAIAIGRRLDEFLSPDEIEGLHAQLARIGPDNPVLADSTARVDAGATQRWLQWVDHYVVGDDGPEVMSVGYDVTDRHVARLALAQSEERFRSLADEASDIVWRVRLPEARFDYVSPSIRRVLGYEPDDLMGDFDRFLAIVEPESWTALQRHVDDGGRHERFDVRVRHADGHVVIIESSMTHGGDAIQGVGRDVTQIRHLQASLAAAASTDALTGLANRRAFDLALTSALDGAAATGTGLAVVYIDLDRLKVVNDEHGHEAGDLVLKEAARRLVAAADGPDLVARLGGDEFAIIHHIRGDSVLRLVARLGTLFQTAVQIGPSTFLPCTASIGVADTATHGWLPNKLVAAADRAMYDTKRSRSTA